MDIFDTLYIVFAVIISGILGYNLGWLRGYDKRTADVDRYAKLWQNEVEHSGELWASLCANNILSAKYQPCPTCGGLGELDGTFFVRVSGAEVAKLRQEDPVPCRTCNGSGIIVKPDYFTEHVSS